MSCSNGIGHRADETEFGETASQMPPAAEVAEPQEMIQEQAPVTDDSTEQVVLQDETVKTVEDDAGIAAEQEPVVDQCQEPMTSEPERPAEEEVEQEVEGKQLISELNHLFPDVQNNSIVITIIIFMVLSS